MAQNRRTRDAMHRNATKYFLYDPVVGAEEGIRKRIGMQLADKVVTVRVVWHMC